MSVSSTSNIEYHVVGRRIPTDNNANPTIYRMRIFARNEVEAKSRFWYFLSQMRKVKKADGEILQVNQINEKRPDQVKNYAIWIRYNSRSGTHNMYKEFRDNKLAGAVDQLYTEMAARHRARRSTIQIVRTGTVKSKDARRPNTRQFHNSKFKFPLPHRVLRAASKKHAQPFKANRPSTFY